MVNHEPFIIFDYVDLGSTHATRLLCLISLYLRLAVHGSLYMSRPSMYCTSFTRGFISMGSCLTKRTTVYSKRTGKRTYYNTVCLDLQVNVLDAILSEVAEGFPVGQISE